MDVAFPYPWHGCQRSPCSRARVEHRMTSASPTCRHCRESIQQGARMCPHCRSHQGWIADVRDPRTFVYLAPLLLAIIGVPLYLMSNVESKVKAFDDSSGSCRDKLHITRSTHTIVSSAQGPR